MKLTSDQIEQVRDRIIQMCKQVGLEIEQDIQHYAYADESEKAESLEVMTLYFGADLATLAALHSLMVSGDTNGLPGWHVDVEPGDVDDMSLNLSFMKDT